MVRITVFVEDVAAQETLDKLAKALDTEAILDEAGALLLNRIRTRFLNEESADGSWLPSKAGLKRRSAGGTGTLFDTGTLFRSIQLSGEGPNERQIGTDVSYGIFHQFGTRYLPKREFLGFNQGDADLVTRFLKKKIERIFS